jgi:hypothetical protein
LEGCSSRIDYNARHESKLAMAALPTLVIDLVTCCCLVVSTNLVIGLSFAIHERVFCWRLWKTLSCHVTNESVAFRINFVGLGMYGLHLWLQDLLFHHIVV